MDADAALVQRLRAGDEAAFVTLVRKYHPTMVRLATRMVGSRTLAEDIVQDTWVGLVRGLDRFEGRSSLKTWLFSILVNRARTAGTRERRSVPAAEEVGGWSTVDPARFAPDGTWRDPPIPWTDEVEDRVLAEQSAARLRAALEQLPPAQRDVVVLRDVHDLPTQAVCELLGVTPANARVLLHRGRARLRGVLEDELGQV